MPQIKLTNVTKRWGNFFGVDNLNLTIEDNAFVTLLGPSGCGKTTTLRMIAGLETPTSGKIEIGDKVVFDSEKGINIGANKRKVGFLFQNYALWPNMTVYKNIAFGLSNLKEDLPVYNEEAKSLLIEMMLLKSPLEIHDLLMECMDKKGLNHDKALLKLIDTFIISSFTAEKILKMNLHKGEDYFERASNRINECIKEIDIIQSNLRNKGYELNDEMALMKNGNIVHKVRSLSKEEIDLKVRRVSRVVKIGMFMDRYPSELSGGQQQRVAIARTLAPEPQVLFMDEPLSNLDAKLRLEMRYELQRLHIETGSTFVYVTHDQLEAMTLSTRICLINNGVLQQYEEPLKVYERPQNLFVADFVGNPSINFIEAKGKQGKEGILTFSFFNGIKVNFKPWAPNFELKKWFSDRDEKLSEEFEKLKKVVVQRNYIEKANKDEVFKYHIQKVNEQDSSIIKEEETITNEDFIIGVRPEYVSLGKGGIFQGEICGVMPTGMDTTVKIKIKDFLLTSVVFGNDIFSIGDKQNFTFKGDNIFLFDRRTGRFITAMSIA